LRYWFRVTNENRKRRKNIVGAGFVPALLATLMVACKKTEDGFIEEKKMKLLLMKNKIIINIIPNRMKK